MNILGKLVISVLFLFAFIFQSSVVFAADYTSFKLDNGQTIIIKEVHDNAIVTIDTWIKTGSINETDKNNGVAHFLEHLFFKGTTNHPTGEFDRILESKGAITNAATSKDFTHYYITLPSCYFKTALELHTDMLLNPLIPRKELEKERKVVLEEISKTLDNPENKLYENMIGAFYQTHPYKRKVIGKKEIIENISREDIMDFYNTWYNPSNMITVVVGDIDTQETIALIKKNFNCKETKKNKMPIYRMDKYIDKQIQIETNGKVKTGYMMIGFRGISQENRSDSYALDVLATILGDGRSSKLYQSIKEQKQLAYSISAGHASMKDDSILFIRANFIPNNKEKLQKAIFYELQKIANGTFDEQDISTAKSIIERDTFYARESTSNIANELGYTTLVYGDSKYYDEYINNIKKVTKADIVKVAKKYLCPNRAVVSIMLPEETKSNAIKEISKVDKKATKIVKENKTITQYILPNGLNLIINQNTCNDIVAMQIYAKGGNFVEQKYGVGTVTASAMMKGTQKYSALDLSQTMEQNGIKIKPAQSSDTFSISIKTTKNDMPLMFELLDEIVNNASFEPQEIERIKTEKIYAIQKKRDIPSNVAFEEFKTKIWANKPYGVTGKVLEKTIPTIKKEDVMLFYQNIFCPKNLTISINGNVNPDFVIEKISNIFVDKQDCNSEIFSYEKHQKDFQLLNKPEELNIKMNSEATWVVLGWLVDGINNKDKRDIAALQVIDSILGSGMSSRLFNNLRGEQGLAYQVGSTFVPNINQGLFAVYIGTNPKTALHAKQELLKQINILKKEFVSEQELQEAKDKILGNFIISQETNMEKASTLGWFEVSGRGIDYLDEYAKLIQSISAMDIIRIANKYFTGNMVSVIVSP